MSTDFGDKRACSALYSTVLAAMLLMLLILVTFVGGGCGPRGPKPSVRRTDGIHKTPSGEVYMQCGDRRTYLGKAVVHEPEEGPTTKDTLRSHEFGTELVTDGRDDYKRKRRH